MATENADVTQAMVDYVFEELRWRSVEFKKTGAVFVYNGDVVKSDSAIPTDLKAALRKAVKSLENIPEIYKDYHPGSDGQVLDLVHPSLFPLIYGRSRVLTGDAIGIDDAIENIGKGITVLIPSDEHTSLDAKRASSDYRSAGDPPYSKHFQWLPCDVDISTGDAKYVTHPLWARRKPLTFQDHELHQQSASTTPSRFVSNRQSNYQQGDSSVEYDVKWHWRLLQRPQTNKILTLLRSRPRRHSRRR